MLLYQSHRAHKICTISWPTRPPTHTALVVIVWSFTMQVKNIKCKCQSWWLSSGRLHTGIKHIWMYQRKGQEGGEGTGEKFTHTHTRVDKYEISLLVEIMHVRDSNKEAAKRWSRTKRGRNIILSRNLFHVLKRLRENERFASLAQGKLADWGAEHIVETACCVEWKGVERVCPFPPFSHLHGFARCFNFRAPTVSGECIFTIASCWRAAALAGLCCAWLFLPFFDGNY